MKITSIHIYGFGRFSNVQFDSFNEHLQVIYGENEAGKTTLMAFIRAILFGFPTKQESELRYEPKQGGTFGGKLTINTERHGQVVIERVKGKARGNVTVYLEDGTIGHEELLNVVLEGLDRAMYQAIFSFGLQDMQHLDMLESEEIGTYLYSVGMAGKWNVSELEKRLEKRQAELFKRSGKLPIINQQLDTLQKLEKHRNEKEAELELDSKLLKKEKETDVQLHAVQEELKKIRESLRHEERLEMLTPLVLKQKELMLQLKKLPDLSNFPQQGMQKLTELRTEKKQLAEKYAEMNDELEQLQTKMDEYSVSDELLTKQAEIKDLYLNLSAYQDYKLTFDQLTKEHEQRNEQLAEVLRRLGDEWNESRLSQARTTMQAKEELVILHDQYRALNERLAFLDVEKNNQELHVTEKRREVERINGERMTEQAENELLAKKQQLIEEEAKIKEAMFRHDAPSYGKLQHLLVIFLLMLLSIGLTYTGLKSNWLVFSILASGFVLVLALLIKQNKFAQKGASNQKQQTWMMKLHEIELEKQKIQAEQNKSKEIEQQVKLATKSYEDVLAMYENSLRQIEQIERRLSENNERFNAWCERGAFPPIANCAVALSLFELVVKGQELVRELMQNEERLQLIRSKLTDFEERAWRLARFASVEKVSSIPLIVEKLVEKLQLNEQSEMNLKFLQERLQQVEKDRLRINEQQAECHEQIQRLLYEANVETEEGFFEKGLFQEEKVTLERELRLVSSQLEAQITNRKQLEKIIVEIEATLGARNDRKKELEEKLAAFEDEEKELEKQLFACQAAREKLVNESELASLLQKMEVEKTHLKQYAVEWAIHETAKQMIKKAKAIYEEKRQPEVMQAAEKWFMSLTCGEYSRVFAPIDESTVTVERKDGVRFLPEELSQGTKEQLYLSLRIALAEAYRSQAVFPLIIDDLFVNFDDERKRAAAAVIKQIAQKRQVLLFTCHTHIKQLFAPDCQWELKKAHKR